MLIYLGIQFSSFHFRCPIKTLPGSPVQWRDTDLVIAGRNAPRSSCRKDEKKKKKRRLKPKISRHCALSSNPLQPRCTCCALAGPKRRRLSECSSFCSGDHVVDSSLLRNWIWHPGSCLIAPPGQRRYCPTRTSQEIECINRKHE